MHRSVLLLLPLQLNVLVPHPSSLSFHCITVYIGISQLDLAYWMIPCIAKHSSFTNQLPLKQDILAG